MGFDFPRKINRRLYIEGMLPVKANKIINSLFDKEYLDAIEVYIEYDYVNGYYYQLKNGYHRYTISRYFNFLHIPVKIKQK